VHPSSSMLTLHRTIFCFMISVERPFNVVLQIRKTTPFISQSVLAWTVLFISAWLKTLEPRNVCLQVVCACEKCIQVNKVCLIAMIFEVCCMENRQWKVCRKYPSAKVSWKGIMVRINWKIFEFQFQCWAKRRPGNCNWREIGRFWLPKLNIS